jgi:tRNA dimethylallyltransferase
MPSNKYVHLEIDHLSNNANLSSDSVAFDRPSLIVLLGPTAVGKTDLAIQLADRLDGEIVSADSRLLYKGMDIGTAKPTPEQRARVPHHLIDVTDPDQPWSLTLYQRAAHEAINGIHARSRLPILVGGTGQYIRAIVNDWRIPKIKPDAPLRHVLENWADEIGSDGLHARLATLDPKAATKIDYRNIRRTIRALEVIFRSGRLFSDQRLYGKSAYNTVQIGISMPRPELYARIDSRIEAMLAAGFVGEVNTLLSRGYAPDLPTFSAIGYREIIDHLLGETTLEQAVTIIKRRTRQFVRRQANWFKEDDPQIHWIQAGIESYSEIESFLHCKLDLD